MVLVKILFAVLILVCAAFYILYVGDFSFVLLVVMCALPILMFIMVMVTRKGIRADFKINEKSAAKGEAFNIQIYVKNKSIFPVGKAVALVEYYNVFNNQINQLQLNFPVQANNSQSVTFQLNSKFCGIVKLKLVYIRIYDPLKIFSFKTGRNIFREIAVLPEGHEISGIISSEDRYSDESTLYSDVRPGDDPSEVFDMRDYIAGDKPNRIHWKLSSKKDEFIVKEYSLPVDSPAAVFLDLHYTEESEYTLPVYDTLMESLVSVSQFFLENEHCHEIIYFSAAENQFVRRRIDSMETLVSAVTELILSVSDDLHCAPPEEFFSENPGFSLSSFTFITAGNGSILSEINENVDADVKNAVIIVKDSKDSDKAEKTIPGMRIIPVVIGRISSSIKDIEL